MLDGDQMYQLARQLFPICRSLTGDGVRETLHILQGQLPQLQVYEVASGTKALDWCVPPEWNIRDGFIADEAGNKIISFQQSNLHIMGYSVPVDCVVDLEELKKHIYVQEDQPEAIPYVTSYYKERYGFCMSKNQRDALKPGKYRMYIDSTLAPGSMTYGELLIPATVKQKDAKEILITTYVCHPSMANNELSGPCVSTALAQWVAMQPVRRYTYRFVYAPETLGAIVYISRNLEQLQKAVIAGFNLTCVGDDRTYSYVESRCGNELCDRVAQNVLSFIASNYEHYSFLARQSDERQYNAPGVDVPMCCILRSKYGSYPEYHTSLDDMSVISPQGLQGTLELMQHCLQGLEDNYYYTATCLCEPQLGVRGLYPNESRKGSTASVKGMMDLLAYADGCSDLIAISDKIGVPLWELAPLARKLQQAGLLTANDSPRCSARL